MKIKDILVIAFFTAALAGLYVYYSGQIKTLEGDIKSLRGKLKSTETALQSKKIELGVYQSQHAKKDTHLKDLRKEAASLRKQLEKHVPREPDGIPGDKLTKKISGMSEDDLMALLGEPASVNGPSSEWWYYPGSISHDPNSGAPYRSVQIHFANQRVDDVRLLP